MCHPRRCWAARAALLVVLVVLAPPVATAAELAAVQRLPQCARPSAWVVPETPADGVRLSARADYLEIDFHATPATTARLLLAEPVPVPEWATDFTFRCTNNGAVSALYARVLMRDATGAEFRFQTRSRFSHEGGVFAPEAAERRGREDRFHTPGMERAVLVTAAGGTIMPPRPQLAPQRPYTLLGLELEGVKQTPPESWTGLYCTDFAFTHLTPASTAGYYLFRDEAQYAELEPAPFLTLGDFGRWFGRRFDLAWEIRRDYAGQPLLAGQRRFDWPTIGWDESAAGRDYPLHLAERVTLPLLGRGTYWVHVKVRWFRGLTPLPDELLTRDYRLDVLQGAAPAELPLWPAAADLPGTLIRVAPARSSFIWRSDDPFRGQVRLTRPTDATVTTALMTVCTAGDGTEVRRWQEAPSWDDSGHALLDLDLADQPAGAYRVRVALLAGEREIDTVTTLIGRQDAAPAAAPAGDAASAPPPAVPLAAELRDGARPLFHLSPILDANVSRDPLSDWETYTRPFVEHAGALSHDFEWRIDWAKAEPLPGVYDWRDTDRFMAAAATQGAQVLLWPEFRAGNLPEWLPGCFVQDPAQRVTGAGAYLFHSARPDYIFAPPVRDALQRFVRAAAQRYRRHAATQGYFLCFENPSDSPWAGWYENYAPPAVAAFAQAADAAYGGLAGANQRWQTHFAAWAELVPPSRLGSFSDRYWLDWLRFHNEAIDGFLKGLVGELRAADAQRLVVVYGEGVRDFAWYRDHGCMLANGGSHDAMQIPGYAAMGLLGLPERTEDHSPGNWTAYFPTQLDASVFAMTMGGGANTHCKAYVRTRFAFKDAADPEASLGRYQRFEPIWTALRQTGPPAIDTYFFPSEAGRLLAARTTWGAWATDTWAFLGAMQAHVPVASGVGGLWQQARLLILPADRATLEEAEVAALETYVQQGGTLMMWADGGRHTVEHPDDDWVLLRRFGFPPPPAPCQATRQVRATPVTGDLFPATAAPFTLRDTWLVPPPPDSTTAATFEGPGDHPALSWRSVGKGRVLVIWAQTALPPMNSQAPAAYPFLRDVARWAGVRLSTDSEQPLFWLNLLAAKDGQTWFGLVHLAQWQDVPAQPASGHARWPGLPDGSYRVTELIHGTDLGTWPAARLRAEGLPVTLAPRAVAIYRLALVP